MRRAIPAALAALAIAVASGWVLGARGGGALADPAWQGPPDFAGICDRVEPGVVHVHTYLSRARDVPEPDDRSSPDDFFGSGFVWSPDGWVVTNRHVVDGARDILVLVKGVGWLPARVQGTDAVVDVALLKVQGAGLPALALGNPRALRVGQWVLSAGSPYRLPRSFSVGIVSGLDRCDVVNPTGYEDYIQTDAAINLGSSGGPLFDGTGRVVGLNTAILSRSGGNQGIGFAVPIDVVAQVVEQLKARGTVLRPTLGVLVRSLTPREGASVPGGEGLLVTRFAEESPARRAGLAVGDVILRVDGVRTPGRGALLRTVWAKRQGMTVTLDILRAGQPATVTPTLIER
jgi:serine protease Do